MAAKVTLKLFAALKECLPAECNGILEVEIGDATTASDLIRQFSVPAQSVHLLLVNGIYHEPKNAADVALSPGDVIAIWPPIAGG